MGGCPPTASPAEVLAVAQLIEPLLARAIATKAASVTVAGGACEAAFGHHAAEIRLAARARLKLGNPPTLRQVIGISNLEVPMNRALGWLLSESSRGVAARRGLLAVAELLQFPELVDDISSGHPVSFYAEASPDLEISSRQPDFLIGSPSAAVLIENKVWSPESGPDQYSHYLELLERWAGGRPSRAYLLARDGERPTPAGWERVISHREVADSLRRLSTDDAISLWDRVVYGLIATDLDPESRWDNPREIERLLNGDHALSEVAVSTRLSQLLRYPTIDLTNGGHWDVDGPCEGV